MSSLVISGDTSGSVTLQAPAVSGSTVLTLPATSGTVLTTASGTASSATTATNLTGGVAGAVPYQSGAGATGFSAAGTSGQLLRSNGVSAPSWATVSSGFTLGTPVATTSGTSFDFTGIPAGTKQIIVNFSIVSTNGTNPKQIQLGDSGGIETTGYLSSGVSYINPTLGQTSSTTGFIICSLIADEVLSGSVVFTLENASTYKWVATGMMSGSGAGAGNMFWNAGEKSLSAELTQLRISTRDGINTFDGGEINIAYI